MTNTRKLPAVNFTLTDLTYGFKDGEGNTVVMDESEYNAFNKLNIKMLKENSLNNPFEFKPLFGDKS